MADKFSDIDLLDSSARKLAAVTPHDTNELADVTKALYVGGAGNVSVIATDDSVAVTFVGVPAGSVLPVRAKIVRSTSTTASNIVAMF